MALGRNQSAPIVRTLRWCGSSMWMSVRRPIPASSCALRHVVGLGGRQQRAGLADRNRSLSRSMAMMSACLVIAQNGRYGGLSTHATGLFARRWVSAACSRSSSA